MRRRLDVAASMIVRPHVLFVDEPTTGLDPAARRDLWRALRSLVAEGTAVLLTTQYLEEADTLADDIILVPDVAPELQPILASVPLQLLAYHFADIKGTDVDQPRNLAKSVTVE